jgi:hypothetical protein
MSSRRSRLVLEAGVCGCARYEQKVSGMVSILQTCGRPVARASERSLDPDASDIVGHLFPHRTAVALRHRRGRYSSVHDSRRFRFRSNIEPTAPERTVCSQVSVSRRCSVFAVARPAVPCEACCAASCCGNAAAQLGSCGAVEGLAEGAAGLECHVVAAQSAAVGRRGVRWKC